MNGSIQLPQGFRVAGVHCGIKQDKSRPDLCLVVSDRPSVAAGVYTTNRVFAAPVAWDRARTPGEGFRAIVVNSGNANACTGTRGDRDTADMARLTAEACDTQPDRVLVLSTGVIGEFLPMDNITAGIRDAASQLAADDDSLVRAARGMMTTDTVHKLSGRSLSLSSGDVRITGMAKGAAMIGPNMATMLAVILTDAVIAPDAAGEALRAVVDRSFNCISVEGHTSTNDSVLLLASGAAGADTVGVEEGAPFRVALEEVCQELARAIPEDGEGATHLIIIDTTGCSSESAAQAIAKTVANSALVKTAVAGGDPNWGRIVSAAGYAGVEFDPSRVSLRVNGISLYEDGAPVTFDEQVASQSIRGQRETHIELGFSEGSSTARFWTTDFTAEYIRLNADYRT